MNNNRTNFNSGPSHKINITSYWLLGFVEGDGSFSINKDKFRHNFTLAQVFHQKPVLTAIVLFLNNLMSQDFMAQNGACVFLRDAPAFQKSQARVVLTIRNFNYIIEYLIPFFSNLTFFSKKGLDFLDWVLVAKMKLAKLHLTQEGKELILAICNRINNNRLTTNPNKLNESDQLLLDQKTDLNIKKLLDKTVTVKQEVWVYDLGTLVIGSPFPTLAAALRAIKGTRQDRSIIDSGRLYQKKYTFYSKRLP